MKIVLYLLSLFFVLACDEPQPKSAPSMNYDNRQANEPSSSFDQTATVDYSLIEERLQGVWKRVDPPYGTVTFQGNELKFEEGAGNKQAATFETFRISNNCAANDPRKVKATVGDFYIGRIGGNFCDRLHIQDDRLTITDAAQTYEIIYKKQ